MKNANFTLLMFSVWQKISFTVACQRDSQELCFNSEHTVFSEKVLHVHQTKML